MTPEKFAERFLDLDLPLTEAEWTDLCILMEEISPGITACLESTVETTHKTIQVQSVSTNCTEGQIKQVAPREIFEKDIKIIETF